MLKKLVKSQSGHAEKPFADHMFFSMTTLSFDKFFDLQSFLKFIYNFWDFPFKTWFSPNKSYLHGLIKTYMFINFWEIWHLHDYLAG